MLSFNGAPPAPNGICNGQQNRDLVRLTMHLWRRSRTAPAVSFPELYPQSQRASLYGAARAGYMRNSTARIDSISRSIRTPTGKPSERHGALHAPRAPYFLVVDLIKRWPKVANSCEVIIMAPIGVNACRGGSQFGRSPLERRTPKPVDLPGKVSLGFPDVHNGGDCHCLRSVKWDCSGRRPDGPVPRHRTVRLRKLPFPMIP